MSFWFFELRSILFDGSCGGARWRHKILAAIFQFAGTESKYYYLVWLAWTVQHVIDSVTATVKKKSTTP